MSISQLFADNVLVRLLRGELVRGDLMVSMVGVKLGDRLLAVGLSDPALLATLGAKVGLTGRASGVDPSAERIARAQRAAEKAGVLVDLHQAPLDALPFGADSFDVAVLRARSDALSSPPLDTAIAGARAVLRDGGRCVAIIDFPAGPLPWRRTPDKGAPGKLVAQLASAGFRAARVLAEREGVFFVEAAFRR